MLQGGLRGRQFAVGMPVSRHPPYGSVQALLTHTVLTSDGLKRKAYRGVRLTYTVQPAGPALPAQCPARVRLFRVLLGQRPSLRDLLRPSLACVRPLHRYYAIVRLPPAVHVEIIAHRFPPPALPPADSGGHRVSRFSCVKFL